MPAYIHTYLRMYGLLCVCELAVSSSRVNRIESVSSTRVREELLLDLSTKSEIYKSRLLKEKRERERCALLLVWIFVKPLSILL